MINFGLFILSTAAALSLSSSSVFGAALVLAFDSGGYLLQDAAGVSLPFGGSTTLHDGAIIQVGYFSQANGDDKNFSGTWTPLTGQGSPNFTEDGAYDTTVGDGPANLTPKNQFQISVNVDSAIQANYPAVGTVMAIRIYNNTSIATSTSFTTLSSNLWKWPVATSLTDPNSRLDISASDDFLRVENRLGAGGTTSTPSGDAVSPTATALRTTVPSSPVPEPSSSLLAAAGFVGFVSRRRNK